MRKNRHQYDQHHRLPKKDKRRRNKRYISSVRQAQHRGWHMLCQESFNPYVVARIINRYFIHPDFYFAVRRLNETDRRGRNIHT